MKMSFQQVLYSVRRTLVFERRLHTFENELSKSVYFVRRTSIFESRHGTLECELPKSAVRCAQDIIF